jgi:hypothetical protein
MGITPQDRELTKGDEMRRYGSVLFFFLILIVALNVIDAFLTMIILDLKGEEVNPVVRSVMDLYGDKFWIWKFLLVSTCLVLLCLHSRLKHVKTLIVVISLIYASTVVYQLFLLKVL